MSNESNWCIKDNDGVLVEEVQVNDVWDMNKLLSDRIEACFVSYLKALSLAEFSVGFCDVKRVPIKTSEVTLYNFVNSFDSKHITSLVETPTEILIESDSMQLTFNGADGMLRKVYVKDSNNVIKNSNVRMKFMTYGTRSGKKTPKSGAYIFLPDNEDAQDLVYSNPMIRVTRGSILSKFELILDKPIPIRHQISLIKGKTYFGIENEFFLGQGSFDNKELMMRFYTDLQNEDTFYTDLNGFQIIKRKRYQKIPIQGNIYPMSTMVYIEDSRNRLNILTGQPLGATSPRSGWVDIFLDRRLLQDDQRGLNQGVVDNRKTKEVFKILLETVPTDPLKPTLESQIELQKLLTPPIVMFSTMKSTISEIYFFHNPLPCNIHLMNLRRSSQPNEFSIFLHRLGVSCETKCANNSSSVQLTTNFSPILIKSLQSNISQMSLSLLHVKNSDIDISDKLHIEEMNISVYQLRSKGD
jgi:alpha-mannosidase II